MTECQAAGVKCFNISFTPKSNQTGPVPYFQPGFFPEHFVQQNEKNRKKCQRMLNENGAAFGLDLSSSGCLNFTTETAKKKGSGVLPTPPPIGGAGELPVPLPSQPAEKEGHKKGEAEGKPLKRVASTVIGQGSTNYLHPDISELLGEFRQLIKLANRNGSNWMM
jgi:hypothetical protein